MLSSQQQHSQLIHGILPLNHLSTHVNKLNFVNIFSQHSAVAVSLTQLIIKPSALLQLSSSYHHNLRDSCLLLVGIPY